MAINATAVWRIRPGGSVNNGAAFDPTISGAGTDYSQQDSAQLTLTDLACSLASTTLTSATGGFTSAMIGNAIQITAGTNFQPGFYFITARTNTNTVTLDRTPAPSMAASAGTGRVGGAWGGSSGVNPFFLADNSRSSTNLRPALGSVIYVLGSGSDAPGSADYTFTGTGNAVDGYASLAAGNTTSGGFRWIGENGRPRIHGSGLMVSATYAHFKNFYVYATSNSNGHAGIIRLSRGSIDNVVVNTNNQSSLIGVGLSAATLINSEIWSGTTSPSTSATAHGVRTPGDGASAGTHCCIIGNKIHHMGGDGINCEVGAEAAIQRNWIYANKGSGIDFRETDATRSSTITHNVIDGNSGHGITFNTLASFGSVCLFANNLITNQSQASKVGFHILSGSATVCNSLQRIHDCNFYYNNTTTKSSMYTGGPNDVVLTASPYVDAATYDYRLNGLTGGGKSCRKAALPANFGTFPATSSHTRISHLDVGAAQQKNTPVLLASGA